MYNKNHNRLLLGGGIAVCLLIAVTSLCLGNVHFTPVQLISLFRGQGDKVSRSILLYARLPRTLASLAAGAGLAVDIDDVILNTTGALVGFWIFCLLRLLLPTRFTEKFQCQPKGGYYCG